MKAKRISYHLLLSLLLPPSLFDLSDQLLHSFGAFGAMGGMLQIDCKPGFLCYSGDAAARRRPFFTFKSI